MKETGGRRVRDAYTGKDQSRDSYLTTFELVKKLQGWVERNVPETDQPAAYPHDMLIRRWCVKWFGKLPKNRIGGRGLGYRISPVYLYVARAWWQTSKESVRGAARKALVEDPKPWVVVVGSQGSTHYTESDVLERVQQILPLGKVSSKIVHVMYVGPMEDDPSE